MNGSIDMAMSLEFCEDYFLDEYKSKQANKKLENRNSNNEKVKDANLKNSIYTL